jgi:hypothetical protein
MRMLWVGEGVPKRAKEETKSGRREAFIGIQASDAKRIWPTWICGLRVSIINK